MIKIIKETITDFVMMFIISLLFSAVVLIGVYLIDLKIEMGFVRVFIWLSFVSACLFTGAIYLFKEKDTKDEDDCND